MASNAGGLPPLPEGCSTIAGFYASAHHTFHDVIGIVTNYGTPKKTRGTDYYMNVTLQDASGDPSSLNIRVFLPNEQLLPRLDRTGDAMLARHVRRMAGENFALANREMFQCFVFDVAHLGAGKGNLVPPSAKDLVHRMWGHPGPAPSLDDKAYAIALKLKLASGTKSHSNQPASFHATPSSSKEKFSLLRDVQVDKFVDIVGEVVKVWDNLGQYLDVYITDYTTNNKLWEHIRSSYGTHQWAGPEGRMTLKVEVHAPHSEWFNSNVRMNDIVLLKNMRVKMSKYNDELQGTLWPDKLKPGKICIELPPKSDPKVQAVIQRKTKHYGGKESSVPENDTKSMSKTQRKKLKKRMRDKAEAAEAASKLTENDLGMYSYKLNPRVKITEDSRPLTTFHDIVFNKNRDHAQAQGGGTVALPFVNVKHQSHFRVVDYFPHDIRAFAGLKDGSYTWFFCLSLVAGDPKDGEKRPIQAIVQGRAAEELLGMKPELIVGNAKGLAEFRDKLWQLWGDLEEKKLTHRPRIKYYDTDYVASREGIVADNMPFEACLSESGVEDSSTGEWIRQWHLFGAKIV